MKSRGKRSDANENNFGDGFVENTSLASLQLKKICGRYTGIHVTLECVRWDVNKLIIYEKVKAKLSDLVS